MAQGSTIGKTKIVGEDGAAVDVAQSGERTVLLVLDPEAKAALRAIQSSLETIATLMQIVVGGGDSLR